MAAVTLAIIASTAVGVGAERRWGRRTHVATGRLLDWMLYVVLPPVSFFIIARLEITAGVGAGLLFAYVIAFVVGGLAWVAGEHLLRLARPTTGALMSTAMQGNTGYLGLPLVATLLGTDQLGPAIAFDAIVSSPIMYGAGFAIGATMGTRAGATAWQRVRSYFVRNPVLFALLLAVLAPDWMAPDAAVEISEAAAIALLPVGFFVLGVNLMHEREDGALDFPPRMTPELAIALALRLLVAPALMLGASMLILRVPDAYLLLAGMPTAINIMIAGHVYGLDLRLMAHAIAWGTAIVVAAALLGTAL